MVAPSGRTNFLVFLFTFAFQRRCRLAPRQMPRVDESRHVLFIFVSWGRCRLTPRLLPRADESRQVYLLASWGRARDTPARPRAGAALEGNLVRVP